MVSQVIDISGQFNTLQPVARSATAQVCNPYHAIGARRNGSITLVTKDRPLKN